MKSIDRDAQGLSGIGSSCKSPCGQWRIYLAWEQILQDLT